MKNHSRISILIIFLILIPFFSLSQIPPYYSGIDFNQDGVALEMDLSQLIAAKEVTEKEIESVKTKLLYE